MPVLTAPPVSEDVASIIPRRGSRSRPLLDPPIVKRAITDSLVKLNPRTMMKNPVMFVVVRFGAGSPQVEASFVQDFMAGLQIPRRASAADNRLRAKAADAVTSALDAAAEVQERYAAAQTIYATITREINTTSLDTLAMLLSEAVATYPEHPEGFVAQQLLLEKAGSYSRNALHGVEEMNAGRWQGALQSLAQAVQMNPHDQILSSLTQNLRELVDVQKEGRQAIDAAIIAGDFATAYRRAAVLDRTMAEREAGLVRHMPGEEL